MKLAVCLVAVCLFVSLRAAAQTQSEAGSLPDSPAPKIRQNEDSSCLSHVETRCGQPQQFTNAFQQPERAPRVANKSFWFVIAGTAATIVMPTIAGIHCRNRNGVEPCTGHYGNFWAIEGTRIGLSAAIFFPMTYALKEDDEGTRHGKWWAPAAALSAVNITFAV